MWQDDDVGCLTGVESGVLGIVVGGCFGLFIRKDLLQICSGLRQLRSICFALFFDSKSPFALVWTDLDHWDLPNMVMTHEN